MSSHFCCDEYLSTSPISLSPLTHPPLLPHSPQSYEGNASFDVLEGFSDFDETLPSLAELSLADAKYQSVSLTADSNGKYGVTLRYFSIQQVTGLPQVSGCGLWSVQ